MKQQPYMQKCRVIAAIARAPNNFFIVVRNLTCNYTWLCGELAVTYEQAADVTKNALIGQEIKCK